MITLELAIDDGERFQPFDRELQRKLTEAFGVRMYDAEAVMQMTALALDVLSAMITEYFLSELAIDTRSPPTGAIDMSKEHEHSHHSHHGAAAETSSKGSQDTAGPATTAADVGQTGGSATTDTSTNAAADQVGSQDAAGPVVGAGQPETVITGSDPEPVNDRAETAAKGDDSDAFG